MYLDELKVACGEELRRRLSAAFISIQEVLVAGKLTDIDADAVKTRLRQLSKSNQEELTRELHGRLGGSGHSYGRDDLDRSSQRALEEIEPKVDLFFLSRRPARTRTEAHTAIEAAAAEGWWAILHPRVTAVSQSRFETQHYADAVEAALKEVNSRTKEMVRLVTGADLDGAALMNRAFSVNNPVLSVGDSSETGRNMQQGYMQIFAGSMMAVRNPKAHANIEISAERAVHFLFLASLLMAKLDEASIARPAV
jgi:uncharacterized protein (TIGR02391 family)